MIAEIAAHVPDSLGAYRGGVSAATSRPNALPLAALRDAACFDATLAVFGHSLGEPQDLDRRALVSYWSQFYFAALATPALTAFMRLGRSLPLAFETTRLELDEAGRPSCLIVAQDSAAPAETPDGLDGLVRCHLRPFVELCHAQCGLAPRVLWGNAATIFDYVARELGDVENPTCAEVASCLGWHGGPACRANPLAFALCTSVAGCRRRRVCCLRKRLPGVPSCGALCPLECGTASAQDAS